MFVTNNTTWVGKTIANLQVAVANRAVFQVEQHPRSGGRRTRFCRTVGGDDLLLAYLKFVLRLSWSLHQMLRVLQLNLFDRRPRWSCSRRPRHRVPQTMWLGSAPNLAPAT